MINNIVALVVMLGITFSLSVWIVLVLRWLVKTIVNEIEKIRR